MLNIELIKSDEKKINKKKLMKSPEFRLMLYFLRDGFSADDLIDKETAMKKLMQQPHTVVNLYNEFVYRECCDLAIETLCNLNYMVEYGTNGTMPIYRVCSRKERELAQELNKENIEK